MDVDSWILEELKRVETKAGLVFQLAGALIAVTVAVIGLGRIPETAKIMMGVAQILLLLSLVPLILAVFPRVFGHWGSKRGEPFGIVALATGAKDDQERRRRMLASRAHSGYRMVGISMVILMVALVVLTAAGVVASFG
jgi:hypothetical protein